MEGNIDPGGWLFINRHGHKGGVNVQCPYSTRSTSNPTYSTSIEHLHEYCGDWCAHFGEPEKYSGNFTEIKLCHGKSWVFDKFTDERKPFNARQKDDE